MLSARQQMLALAMATIGALAWWQQQGKERPGLDAGDQERRPDYTVDNFTATTMDELGKPHRRLTANELLHYPDDDSNLLENPRLTLLEESAPPWLVRSETAQVSGDGNLIRLHGEVLIDREAGIDTQPVHLKTHELILKRQENFAQTDRPVRITSDSDWVTADNGAQIWLGEHLRVKLIGRVRGEMAIR